ncbi:MAG: tetratricopeptide repeat protein [Elusimicrobia bacterium]|nr:tetratricopeptide repeat protein [Elusimicrobiota bacterium]
MYRKLTYFAVAILLSVFYFRIVSTIKVKSETYDEIKCLRAGEYLTSGSGWVVEASVFHSPLSYYIHGFLLKGKSFKNLDDKIFNARLIMAVFPVIFGFFIFKYSKEKFGELSGLVALFLFTWCPNIIAFSCLIVPDMLVAFFIFLGFYTYQNSLEKIKSVKKSILAGLIFGLALLSKYTGVFLVPIYLLLGLRKLFLKEVSLKNYFKQFIIVIVVGLFILNAGYKFTGSFKPLKDFSFESKFFSDLSGLKVLSKIPLPIPEPFIYGFDIQKHTTEVGHPTFLLGKRSIKGWWYYFIIAFLIKVPIPFLLLIFFAVLRSAVIARNEMAPARQRFSGGKQSNLLIPIVCLTLPFVLFTNSNPGLRYLLPVFPFLFVYISDLVNIRKKVFTVIIWFLLVWFAIESVLIHPHYLAYFNQFIGGPKNGYKYLADSNIDWGQDRFLVIKNLKINPDIKLNPTDPVVGRFLINVNNLQDVFCIEEPHKWLKQFKPVGNIGYSWLLYDIKLSDYKKLLDKNPQDYYLNYLMGFVSNGERYLKKCLEINPEYTPAKLKLGLIYWERGDSVSAISEFGRVIKGDSNNYYAYKYLSEINQQISHIKLAQEYDRKYKIAKILNSYAVPISIDENYYKKAIEKNPQDAKSWNNLGFIYWMKSDFSRAIINFKKASELNPNFVDYIGNLAVAYKDKGMQKEYLDLKNQYFSKYNLISSARVSQIQYGESKMILEDIFVLSPDN